jgi:7-cyano-7-deazaguanine synthase in queuosine biosynthesis
MRIVQLYSGGLDSVAQALVLQSQGHTIYPMYVQFRLGGGKVAKEMRAMYEISEIAGHEEPYVLTHRIPKSEYGTRNRTMCKLAATHAQKLGVDHIAIGTVMFPGPFSGDFPREDGEPTHLQAAVPKGITVITRLVHKSVIVAQTPEAQRYLLFKSKSCHMYWKDECGSCFACVERHAAFLLAMGYDHTPYHRNPKLSRNWRRFYAGEASGYAAYIKDKENQNETT